ncbi:hypothetical protein EYF80_028093 [Liparis tanakae]|uniref:Uncharacterized protein n=1 Tax=Liparis tanakae TaxID=230148 RepID=A0A4Z2H9D9_9TELE|nr:hypothetical protein EYF80_028093 [Liparis tanakae]
MLLPPAVTDSVIDDVDNDDDDEALAVRPPIALLKPLVRFNFDSGGMRRVNLCQAHQRQAGRDGETVTGPLDTGRPDDDEQP